MTLKAVVDTLDTVPEPARVLYVEKEGKFHLQVEGLAPVSKLNEFRDNNIKLMNEKAAIEKKFEGVDLEAYNASLEQARKLKDKQLIDAGQFDQLFEQRITPMRQAHETELAAERSRADGLATDMKKLVIDGTLRDAAVKAGVNPSAIDDVLLRGRGVFQIVNGKAVAMDGDKTVFGPNGEELGADGWLGQMQKAAPHWWPASQGGGGKGNNGQGGGGANTMTRKAFDALGPAEKMATVKTHKIVD